MTEEHGSVERGAPRSRESRAARRLPELFDEAVDPAFELDEVEALIDSAEVGLDFGREVWVGQGARIGG